MYHTGNFLQRKQVNPTIPHGSHLSASHMTNPFAQGGDVDCCGNSISMINCSIPTDTTADADEQQEIYRTRRSGFLFGRNRSAEEQRLLSQQRAAEMIARFEMSDNKEDSLNRKGTFGPPPLPSLGACLGAQQAAFAAMSETRTVSFGQRERNKWGRFHKDDNTLVSEPSRPPLKPKGNTFTFDQSHGKKPVKKLSRSQQRIEIALATRMRLNAERVVKADSELPSEVGMDVIPVSPGVYSVAPTMAETPSPRPPLSPAGRPPHLRALEHVHRLC